MPKTKKASVLVYSLIILSVMLMIAAAFTSTSIISRKNASTTSKSSQSFQVADSGANLAIREIKNAGYTDRISDIYSTCSSDNKVTLGPSSGLRSGSTAEIVFKDEDGDVLTCSDEVSKVRMIKSTGKFADTARAIEVAVAAVGLWDYVSGTTGPIHNVNGSDVWIGSDGGSSYGLRISSNTSSAAGEGDIMVSGGSDNQWGLYGDNDPTKPVIHLDMNGYHHIGINGDASKDYDVTVHGTVSANVVASSDERYKQNIETIDDSLSKLLNLRGVTFDWKREEFPDEDFPGGQQIGVIAQEVEKVLPQLVTTNENGYKSVNYNGLAPVLIEGIKQQQQQIDALNAKNQELERRIEALENAR